MSAINRVVAAARRRLEGEEGFTLMELTIVLLVMTILMAIAIPSYLGAKDRAEATAAKQDVAQAVRSVVAYGTDNFPLSQSDPNAINSDSGYENITLAALAAHYDANISVVPGAPYILDPAGWPGDPQTDFCITALVGRWTAVQAGPQGSVTVGTTFDPATCAVS